MGLALVLVLVLVPSTGPLLEGRASQGTAYQLITERHNFMITKTCARLALGVAPRAYPRDLLYALWLGVRNNPLTVIVAKDDYQPTMTHRRDHEKSGGHHRLQAQESVVVCCF